MKAGQGAVRVRVLVGGDSWMLPATGRPRQRAIDVTATIVATRRRENTVLMSVPAVATVEVAATVRACPWYVLAFEVRTATFVVEKAAQHDVAGTTPLLLLLLQSGNRSCARIGSTSGPCRAASSNKRSRSSIITPSRSMTAFNAVSSNDGSAVPRVGGGRVCSVMLGDAVSLLVGARCRRRSASVWGDSHAAGEPTKDPA